MRRALILSCVLLAGCGWDEDPDRLAGVTPCGDVSTKGECRGNVHTYCSGSVYSGLFERDCSESGLTCVEGIKDNGGAGCAVEVGGTCEFWNANGFQRQEGVFNYELGVRPMPYQFQIGWYFYEELCLGSDAACVSDREGKKCVSDFPVRCESVREDDPLRPYSSTRDFEAYCHGNYYVYGCNHGQPVAEDCAALGGSCDDERGCMSELGGKCGHDMISTRSMVVERADWVTYTRQLVNCAEGTCLWDEEGGTCVADVPIECDEENFEPRCEGDYFVYGCNNGRPVVADCNALGGTGCLAETREYSEALYGCLMEAGGQCKHNVATCTQNCELGQDDTSIGVCTES